jgi:branched-subunit amino acid transport protein AzlD
MKVSINFALVLSFAMGLVIFFCRAFPFLFFREKRDPSIESDNKKSAEADHTPDPGSSSRREAFLRFVEKVAPPVAMTVLAFNAIASSLKTAPETTFPVLIAAAFTAFVHVWKRNSLLSIVGGTALYMILERF